MEMIYFSTKHSFTVLVQVHFSSAFVFLKIVLVHSNAHIWCVYCFY